MRVAISSQLFSDNIKILKSEVSKTAFQGVLIAIAAIIFGTLGACLYSEGGLSLSGILAAQQNNVGLWVLDGIPFIFGFWGQYSSTLIAYQAGAMIQDQTQELRDKTDELEKQANYASTHDALTDLPNRSLFYDRVQRAITSATHRKQSLAVVLVELANFKEIYDTLGRNSSDLILKQVAKRLEGVSPEQDSVARIDGSVFAILLTNLHDTEEAEHLAGSIQTALDHPFLVDKVNFSVHNNIGIVHCPEHGEDVDTLVQKAGVALGLAQSSNKGYATYQPALDKRSLKRLTLMSELRQAIDTQQLELFYQAKIDIASHSVIGVEALIRWHHPVHLIISPDEFIPMTERTRLIKLLTPWVLKQAFKQASRWRQQGLSLKISVNLSTKDLLDPELPDLITGIAAAKGTQPEQIILEITESSAMRDPERTLGIINRLHNMGYAFSIDDFGTGYSSLAYLKKMPLAELKIDKSFITDILHSEHDEVIVKTMIHLAHNLGLNVTAEGVENADVLAKLKQLGCDLVQGYYFNKPMSIKDFEAWYKSFETSSSRQ